MMECGTTRLAVDMGEDVAVFTLGDIHEGNANVDYTALNAAVKTIKDEKRQKAVILTGDLIEAITPDDKRWCPTAVYQDYALRDLKNLPFIQSNNVCKILEPIKNDVVAILIGNHEEVYIKKHFGDVYAHIADKFPHAIKLGGSGFYRFVLEIKGCDPFSFDFSLKHGTAGGGRMMGYQINKARETFEFEIADFCIMGHLHKLEAKRVRYREMDHVGQNIVERKMWYGVSGTFKRTYVTGNADWYEQRGREEADIGMLGATFSVTRPHHSRRGPRPYLKNTNLERMYFD